MGIVRKLLLVAALVIASFPGRATGTLATVEGQPDLTTEDLRDAGAVMSLFRDEFVLRRVRSGEGGEEAYVRAGLVMLAANRVLAAQFDAAGMQLARDAAASALWRAEASLVMEEEQELINAPAVASLEELKEAYRLKMEREYTSAPASAVRPSFMDIATRLRADVEREKRRRIRDRLMPELAREFGFADLGSTGTLSTTVTTPLYRVAGRIYTTEDFARFAGSNAAQHIKSRAVLDRFAGTLLFLESARRKGRTESDSFRRRLRFLLMDAKARQWVSSRPALAPPTSGTAAAGGRVGEMETAVQGLNIEWDEENLTPYAL